MKRILSHGRNLPKSLVARLVASFLLPSLAISLLVALVAHHWVRDALRESVFERLEVLAVSKEAALDDWVEQRSSDVALLATLEEIAEHCAVAAGSKQAQEAARRDAVRQLEELFKRMIARRPSLDEIFILSPVGGQVLVSTKPERVGEFRTRDTYFTAGRSGLHVQKIYPSPVTLEPTLTISAPIPEPAGDGIVGVLVAHLSLEYLDRNILQRAGLGESGVVTLVDRHRVLVTGHRYGGELASGPSRSLAVEEVLQKRRGRGLYADLAGLPVIGVYRWLEDHEIGLIVEIGQWEAFAPARRLALSILAVGLPAIALLVGGAFLVARRIAAPIREMATLTARVSGGDLETRVPVRTHDEIGVLACSFNEMIGKLAKLYEEMRAKIGELELAKAEKERLIAELEEKNAELERFTYTVSHDLKTPLVTVRGFLGHVKNAVVAQDCERAQRDLGFIEEAAEHMGQMLEELLELSRLGRVVYPPEKVSLRDLCLELAKTLPRPSGAEIHVAADLPVVHGDRLRLWEVFENLLTNAFKFMGDQPAPRVEIGVRHDAGQKIPNEAAPVLFVRDNGSGIDPRYGEKIFGLFERLDPGVEGTGIGLTVVRRVVELHGGHIWVESDGPGRGSTFCLTLPILEPAAAS